MCTKDRWNGAPTYFHRRKQIPRAIKLRFGKTNCKEAYHGPTEHLNLNFGPRTHEGAPARNITPEQQLRRSVLACMLWETQFYEDGVEIAGRIDELVPKVEAEKVAALAVEAREQMKLRHAPLLLVREMARHATHRALVAETLARVIQRADELAEFVAIYWKDGRVPLSAQVKKGLAAAFAKFDEYALAKYDRAGAVQAARRALPLARQAARRGAGGAVEAAGLGTSSPRPTPGRLRSRLGRRQARGVGASARASASWARWRCCATCATCSEAGVDEELVLAALARDEDGARSAVPFPRCGALRSAVGGGAGAGDVQVRWRAARSCRASTVLLVDVSGSMTAPLSRRSEMRRTDAAYGLAILLREIAEKVSVYTFSDQLVRGAGAARLRPARRDRREPAARRHVPRQGASSELERERGLRPPDRHHRRAGARPRSRAARARAT